jgi:hypothetical protein
MTTVLPRASIAANPAAAAAQALHALTELRGEPVTKVIVKLGFNWMGHGNLAAAGLAELTAVLQQLFRGNLDRSHSAVLVQEQVPFQVEPHFVLFHGRVVHEIWMRWSGKNSQVLSPERALAEIFNGDADTMELARSKCLQLKDLWWRWLKSICCEEQAFVRMDFLCNIAGPGNADVWTCELSELGCSTKAMPDGRKRVFDLIVENLLSGPGEAAAPEPVAAVS